MSKSSLKINEYLCRPYNMTPIHSLLYFTIYTIIKIAGETWLKRAILTEQISMNKMIIILCIIVLQIPCFCNTVCLFF